LVIYNSHQLRESNDEPPLQDPHVRSPEQDNPSSFVIRGHFQSPQLREALAGLDGVIWAEEEMPEAFDITQALEPDSGI